MFMIKLHLPSSLTSRLMTLRSIMGYTVVYLKASCPYLRWRKNFLFPQMTSMQDPRGRSQGYSLRDGPTQTKGLMWLAEFGFKGIILELLIFLKDDAFTQKHLTPLLNSLPVKAPRGAFLYPQSWLAPVTLWRAVQQAPQESGEKGLLCLVPTAFPGPGIMLVLKSLFNKAVDYCRPVLPNTVAICQLWLWTFEMWIAQLSNWPFNFN